MRSTLGSRGNVRTIIVCMLANNFTLGLMIGTFGALLASSEQALSVTRDTISFGMSAMTTMMGLSTLVMGGFVRRITPRIAIMAGVLASAAGFLGLGLTTNFAAAIAMWSLVGFGIALAALLGPVALAAEQFSGRSGKFLAVVNMPIMLFLGPWLVTIMLPTIGRSGVHLLMATALVPVALLVLLCVPSSSIDNQIEDRSAGEPSASAILGRSDFWLISLGIGLIASSGTAYTVHAIAFAQSEGMTSTSSALMMSVYMGAGLLGVPVFGWLADRMGAPATLALTGLIQCLCWAGLALLQTWAFLPIAAVLGAATTPLTTLHGAAMAQIFGSGGAGKAMGYSYVAKMPLMFVAPPALGYAYVQFADYRPALLAASACLVFAIVLLLVGNIRRVQQDTPPL